jgi:hypothetical protein
MTGRQVHRVATLAFSLAMVVIGLALIVEAVAGSGGPGSARTLLGALFVAAGIARGYLELRRGRRA